MSPVSVCLLELPVRRKNNDLFSSAQQKVIAGCRTLSIHTFDELPDKIMKNFCGNPTAC